MFSSICRILCISFLYCINYTVAQRSLRGTAGCGQITTICMADLDSVWFGSSSWRTLGASIDQRNPCVVRSLISHSSRYGAWLRNAPIPEAVLRKRCRHGSRPSARQVRREGGDTLLLCTGWVRQSTVAEHSSEDGCVTQCNCVTRGRGRIRWRRRKRW